MIFKINTERTNESQIAVIVEMNDGVDREEIEVTTRWDGCTDFFFSSQYIHVCDIESLLEAIHKIRERSLQYFDGEFCVAPLRAEEVKQKLAHLGDQW